MEDESLSQCLHFIPYSTSLHKFQNYLGAQRERFEVTDSLLDYFIYVAMVYLFHIIQSLIE